MSWPMWDTIMKQDQVCWTSQPSKTSLFGFNSYQEDANTPPNLQSIRPCPGHRGNVHTGVLNAQVFEGTGHQRLARCCSDPSGHEICDVILIEACRQKMNQWAVPLVWVGSLHRKCTERSETVRLLQQAAESVLAVVGTGLACFAARAIHQE